MFLLKFNKLQVFSCLLHKLQSRVTLAASGVQPEPCHNCRPPAQPDFEETLGLLFLARRPHCGLRCQPRKLTLQRMSSGDAAFRHRHWALALCLALAMPWLSGCQRGASPDTATDTATLQDTAATRPVNAIHVLRDRLLARDGAGFARLAVPPALHAQLQQAWSEGRSRWPLDELPLDARIPKMLAALQAPNADKVLMATFRKQFAGADADIDQAVRTLVVFGSGYLQESPDDSSEERDHSAQALTALGHWAVNAPLSDPKRAQRFFTALSAAAIRSGIDSKAGNRAFATLGMTQSLNRLSPFLATLLDQLNRQYRLDIDAALRSLHVTLLEQTGDNARLRLHYVLSGQPIDTVIPVVRIDGHWYLSDYVRRAQASLQGGAP